MKKKIIFFSGSRADYDLINSIYQLVSKNKTFNTYLLVTGTNLDRKYNGKNIISSKPNILKVKVNLKYSNKETFSKIFSEYVNKFYKLLLGLKPNLIVVLGDRYETLAISIVAKFLDCKLIHLHGGEKTEGSLDNIWRNVISILSDYHFTSLNIYKNKVIKLIGKNNNVFNFGSVGAFNIKKTNNKLYINNKFNKKILVSYHSATKSNLSSRNDFLELLKALTKFKKNLIFFTYPGHDIDSDFIIKNIQKFCRLNKNSIVMKKAEKFTYSELLNSFDILIGNSSAGIIEAPSAQIPTLNIGNRQKGRIFGPSIFHTKGESKKIYKKINLILKMKKINYFNPYYKKNVLKNINNQILKILNKI